ncbi:MAG: hypothetical protein LC667_02215 [Thioalkalivibrio sp.]|nr:hypothetical protein [Thioalkalivibrio sp.]
MKRKDTSVLCNVCPQLAHMLALASEYYAKNGAELTVTSGAELSARHSRTSLHYIGHAVDLRTWPMGSFTTPERHRAAIRSICDEVAQELSFPPNWFDVVLENTHLHAEYQPKGPL